MADEATKTCPYCAETIKADAIKCKHCGSDLTEAGKQTKQEGTNQLLGCILVVIMFGLGFFILLVTAPDFLEMIGF